MRRRLIDIENQSKDGDQGDLEYQGCFQIEQDRIAKGVADCEKEVNLQAPINTINQRSPPSTSSPVRVGTALESRQMDERQVAVPQISRVSEAPNSIEYNSV